MLLNVIKYNTRRTVETNVYLQTNIYEKTSFKFSVELLFVYNYTIN